MKNLKWSDLSSQSSFVFEANEIAFLEEKFESPQDLLLHSVDELAISLKNLQISPQKLEQLLIWISKNAFPLETLQILTPPSKRLSTLDPELDEYFGGGGIPSKTLIEFSGVAGVGKSNLALQLAISATLAFPNSGVLYICTEGNFPFQRLFDIFSSRFPHLSMKELQERYCSRIWVQHFAEYQVLEHFIAYQAEVCIQKYSACLLVIDSVVANARAEENRPQVALAYQQIAHKLTGIASDYDLFTICINQASAYIEEESGVNFNWRASIEHLAVLMKTVPALGLAWANCVGLRVFFWRGEEPLRQRKMVILWGCAGSEGGNGQGKSHCNFYIYERGISLSSPCNDFQSH